MMRMGTREFIDKAVQLYSKLYDYSQVEYVNTDTKIRIACLNHGVFETTPYRHLHGVKCPQCAGPKYRELLESADKKRLGKKSFVEKAKLKHGNKYDYSRVVYINNRTKVEMLCKKHGMFMQSPSNHMKGAGCPGCKFEKTGKIFVKYMSQVHARAKLEYIPKVQNVHDNKYDYSETEYVGWNKKIKIVCREHGPFYQTANNHKAGRGCPLCAPSGFDETKPAILYYLQVKAKNSIQSVYKIGVTNRTVLSRYPLLRDRQKIKILNIWHYDLGVKAREHERQIVEKNKHYLYCGNPLLSNVGISEMFTKDILGLNVHIVGGAPLHA